MEHNLFFFRPRGEEKSRHDVAPRTPHFVSKGLLVLELPPRPGSEAERRDLCSNTTTESHPDEAGLLAQWPRIIEPQLLLRQFNKLTKLITARKFSGTVEDRFRDGRAGAGASWLAPFFGGLRHGCSSYRLLTIDNMTILLARKGFVRPNSCCSVRHIHTTVYLPYKASAVSSFSSLLCSINYGRNTYIFTAVHVNPISSEISPR